MRPVERRDHNILDSPCLAIVWLVFLLTVEWYPSLPIQQF